MQDEAPFWGAVFAERESARRVESSTFGGEPSIEAEREGFEPSIEVTPYAGLANLCLQPLGHLSG